MKKKVFLGMLIAAFTFVIMSCNQPSQPQVIVINPSAPNVTGVIFVDNGVWDNDFTWNQAKEHNTITLSKSRNYRLGVFWSDLESDVDDIALSTDPTFSSEWWHWEININTAKSKNGIWTALGFQFANNSSLRSLFPNGANQTLWLRAHDKQNNTHIVPVVVTITD